MKYKRKIDRKLLKLMIPDSYLRYRRWCRFIYNRAGMTDKECPFCGCVQFRKLETGADYISVACFHCGKELARIDSRLWDFIIIRNVLEELRKVK